MFVSTSILLDPQLHQPPIISQSDSFHPDIGKIYADSKLSSLNFCSTIQSLSASEKYALLKKHDKPSEHHLFPVLCLGITIDNFSSNGLIYTLGLCAAL